MIAAWKTKRPYAAAAFKGSEPIQHCNIAAKMLPADKLNETVQTSFRSLVLNRYFIANTFSGSGCVHRMNRNLVGL